MHTMFLSDYHVHTKLSPDAEDSMLDMALAAEKRGITQMCFTNHVETCAQSPSLSICFPPFEQWDEMYDEYRSACAALDGRMDLRLGVEVDDPHHMPDTAMDIYRRRELDFVIGSIHSLRGMDDFYVLDYPDNDGLTDIFSKYYREYMEIVELGACDVLGHLGYMLRYMAARDRFFDLSHLMPIIGELLKKAIDAGIGIEVNTSGLFGPLKSLIPNENVLRLYRSLGGEIITVGSDAHSAAVSGLGVPEAFRFLKDIGYEYVTTFRAHKPEFIKI